MKLFELYAELGLDASGFDSGVKNATKKGSTLASSLKSGLGGAASSVGRGISATTVMMGNLMASAVQKGAAYVKDFVGIGLDYNSTMETYVTNFSTMLGGSSEAAQQLTGDLEDMAASTPFAMADLAGATQTLLAFGQDSGTVLDTLQSLGDIAMGDANKLSSLTLAFAQASSSGKLMGQDLMQMVNAGFNPLQTIVDLTGASMGDLKDFMSDGKATSELRKQMRAAKKEVKAMGDEASEGAKLLARMSEDGAISAETLGMIFDMETGPGGRFYNAMQNASQTFEGMISTLKDDSAALLGKVFQPMSNWIKDDLLPKAQNFIKVVSEGFDTGGIKGAWGAATEAISGYLSELGGMALDAGANLLANVLTGLTGDTVSGTEIKQTFSDLWTDVQGGIDGVKTAGTGILKGIYEGLTRDSENRGNIVQFFTQMFADIKAEAEGFSDALAGIYEKMTNKEATAENVGASIGQGVKGYLQYRAGQAKSLIGLPAAVNEAWDAVLDENKTAAEKVEDVLVTVGEYAGEAVGEVIAGAGNMVGAATGIDSPEEWIERAGGLWMLNKWRNDQQIATGYTEQHGYTEDPGIMVAWQEAAEKNATIIKSQTDLMNMISTMWASNAEFGLSESQLDNWLSIIQGGKKDEEYYDVAKQVMDAFEGTSGLEDISSAVEALSNATAELTATAAALPGATASAVNGAKVEMDGVTVGELVLPTVSAGLSRQFMVAALTQN